MQLTPKCFAIRQGGRWIGVCRHGLNEDRTIAGYDTRAEAVQAAREIASRLNDAEVGMAWWNGLSRLERAVWLAKADSARPCDAWETFKAQTGRAPAGMN